MRFFDDSRRGETEGCVGVDGRLKEEKTSNVLVEAVGDLGLSFCQMWSK